MRRVLLTGASGFIGRHCIAPLIAAGYEVHAVTQRARAEIQSEVIWHHADLMNGAEVVPLLGRARPTDLLHLAWYVEPGKLIDSAENFRWVQASLELVRRFAEAGGERLVVAGSGYEYDWRYGYCSEQTTPTAPDTVYGICKDALRRLLLSQCDALGISCAWARIFFLYGPHEHPRRLVASVIRSLLAGEAAHCSHGRQIRDYAHVEDVAGALVALLSGRLSGPVNVATGEPISLAEIVQKIGAKLERPALIRLGALPARENDAPLVVADVRRLTEGLGWAPRHDLDSGLDHTIDWWRAHLHAEQLIAP